MFFIEMLIGADSDVFVTILKEFGFPVVVAVAALTLAILAFRSQKNMNEKQQSINAEQQAMIAEQQKALADKEEAYQEMFTRILNTLASVNKNTNPIHEDNEEEENRKLNLLINTQLNKIMDKTGANRVSCFSFHNGGKDVIGRSFQKMSMTHEAVDANTISVMGSYQNIPRMMFPILVQKIAEVGYYDISNLEDIKSIDATTYQSFYARGAHAVYIRAIKSSEGKILGFITAEFISSDPIDEGTIRESLLNKAMKISGALEIDSSTFNDKGGERK